MIAVLEVSRRRYRRQKAKVPCNYTMKARTRIPLHDKLSSARRYAIHQCCFLKLHTSFRREQRRHSHHHYHDVKQLSQRVRTGEASTCERPSGEHPISLSFVFPREKSFSCTTPPPLPVARTFDKQGILFRIPMRSTQPFQSRQLAPATVSKNCSPHTNLASKASASSRKITAHLLPPLFPSPCCCCCCLLVVSPKPLPPVSWPLLQLSAAEKASRRAWHASH